MNSIKFLIINDFNDINNATIRHFSLDKGHFIAKSLVKLNHIVYFLTTLPDYSKNGIEYLNIDNITDNFIETIDYVMIVREPLFIDVINKIPAIKNKIAISKTIRTSPKFIIKSDSATWFKKKNIINALAKLFNTDHNKKFSIIQWMKFHVDYICAQNIDFANAAYRIGIPSKSILISNMSITNDEIDYSILINPYDINHNYCVDTIAKLADNKAFWPFYYINHPEEKINANTAKYIIVYTGRIKTDSGKILYNMKNIMNILGEEYELHLFPGSFVIPINQCACDDNDNNNNTQALRTTTTRHSGKNASSLNLLRTFIFNDLKNIIIHHPYDHADKYRYLHFADCGIDFSDLRPSGSKPMAGHAKILEYCEVGLPVVCEANIHNLFLVENGKNGIVLPFMASDEEYANAIRKIVTMSIDREYCRDVTVKNENWDKRTIELIEQLRDK